MRRKRGLEDHSWDAHRTSTASIDRVQTVCFLTIQFNIEPTYPAHVFERRFRISPAIFERVRVALEAKYRFFQQRRDATGEMGFNSHQKCTAALRMLPYGVSADMLYKYLIMGEYTDLRCLKHFASGLVALLKVEYLYVQIKRRKRSCSSARIVWAS